MTSPTSDSVKSTEEAPHRRERLRHQTKQEAKAVALQQLRDGGAAAISLNAIGKHLGMSGPALYRYFAGWDGLLTELIGDAYRDLAIAVESAPADLPAVAATLRKWALTEPHRYLLIFGTPIPGYQAPSETLELAVRVMAAIINCLPSRNQPARAAVPMEALQVWSRLHGVISLEATGHFAGMGFDVQTLFNAEVESLSNETQR